MTSPKAEIDLEQKKAARRAMFRASQKKRRDHLRTAGKEPVTLVVKKETTVSLKQIQADHEFITMGEALDFLVEDYHEKKVQP